MDNTYGLGNDLIWQIARYKIVRDWKEIKYLLRINRIILKSSYFYGITWPKLARIKVFGSNQR